MKGIRPAIHHVKSTLWFLCLLSYILDICNPAILLIFFLTSFFHCLLPPCCECSPCILNCLYINSTYGKRFKGTYGWCSSFRCWMWRWQIHVCPCSFHPSLCNHTDLSTISKDVWGKSWITWSMVQPKHSRTPVPFSWSSVSFIAQCYSGRVWNFYIFLGNKWIFSTSNIQGRWEKILDELLLMIYNIMLTCVLKKLHFWLILGYTVF